MSYAHKTLVFVVSMVCALAALSFVAPRAAAADVNISLFGSRAGGWGATNTTISTPGPPLTVHVGDNVTLNLTSDDGITHNWFIDYNDNNASGGSEPTSPNFAGSVLWNFTVSNVTGTFHYRSDRAAGPGTDLTTMWGDITILPAEGPGLFGADNSTLLVIVGSIVIVAAVLVFAMYFWRRMKTPPPPPEKE